MPKNLSIADLCDFYGGILTKKQYYLLRYYYDNDLSLAEIAELENITPQGVRDIIKRAEQKLVETEEKLQFFAQHKQLKTRLQSAIKADEETLRQTARLVADEL